MGNAQSSVPFGAQSVISHIQLDCSYNPIGSALYDATFSFTAPLSGASGQQYSISDFSSTIYLPVEIEISFLDQGAAYYEVNTTLTFETTDALPQLYVVNEYRTYNNISCNELAVGQANLRIDIPKSGETQHGVLALGPFTLGTPGQSDFLLKRVDFELQNYAGNGNPVDVAIANINCQPKPEYNLASVVVTDSAPGPLLAPANNAPVQGLPTVRGQQSTTASIPVSCSEDRINPSTGHLDYTFNYTFSATGPIKPTNGVPFNLTNVNNFLTVPGPVANYATALDAGVCGLFVRLVSQDGLPGLGLSFSNAAPGSVDVSNTFVASDSSTPNPLVTGRYVDCQNTDPVIFPFPNLGYLDLTGIVANNVSGSAFSVSFGDIQGNIEGDNTFFGYAGFEKWICKPLVKPILLSAPIG